MAAETSEVRVIHVGLGQIGRVLARLTEARAGLSSVAAVDANPELAGRTLEQLCDGGSASVTVRSSLAEALDDGGEPRVAFHAVASHVLEIEGQLTELAEAGLDVVTTAEELIHPYKRHAAAAGRLDDVARANGVTLVAAGVNPGMLMDRLPAYLSSLSIRVESVRVRRLVDLSQRRAALRRKMAVGDDPASVMDLIGASAIGHVGLVESLEYVADSLGWEIGPIDEKLSPVVAERRVERAGETVEVGRVLGLDHTATAVAADGRPIELSLTMRLDATEPYDEIRIDGQPPIHARFEGGINGDQATVATVLNAARFAVESAPGLLSRIPLPAGA
jgi:hypothetical protein